MTGRRTLFGALAGLFATPKVAPAAPVVRMTLAVDASGVAAALAAIDRERMECVLHLSRGGQASGGMGPIVTPQSLDAARRAAARSISGISPVSRVTALAASMPATDLRVSGGECFSISATAAYSTSSRAISWASASPSDCGVSNIKSSMVGLGNPMVDAPGAGPQRSAPGAADLGGAPA